jgi:hypothetical protein
MGRAGLLPGSACVATRANAGGSGVDAVTLR